jgi:hypothetical protein
MVHAAFSSLSLTLGWILLAIGTGGVLVSGGIITAGAVLHSASKERHTERPADVRDPTWVAPRASPAAKATFITPLSFSF